VLCSSGRMAAVIAVIAILSLATCAFAGLNTEGKVAVHVIPHDSRSCTKAFPLIPACSDIVYTEPGPDADCFPVFFDLVEYQGFDYGLTWPGMYSTVFTSCSDLTIGGIQFPGDGISHAWTECQPGPIAIPGWGWIYDYGTVSVVAHPDVGIIKIGDCQDPVGLDATIASFYAGIGGFAGEDPCEPVGPACEVEPTSLDFGTVTVGQNSQDTFVIRNTGGGTLTGNITETCPDYSVDVPSYSVPAGNSVVVTVTFAPTGDGTKLCTIDTDTACDDVGCTGIGEPAPACQLTPDNLAFGTLTTGDFLDKVFVIENTGGGTLTGLIDESCAYYNVWGGAGAFGLAAGETLHVGVRFQPLTAGDWPCTITTGTTCNDVPCTGAAEDPPECEVEPTSFDFGTVTVGESVDTTFVIRNVGGGILSGTVVHECTDYSVDVTDYNIPGGDSVVVTVTFEPTDEGTRLCTIDTDNGCDDVSCTGEGEFAPICDVKPASLPFGEVMVGASADLTFRIKNTGGGTLDGEVTETCDDYDLTSGGGVFALAGGDSVIVTVRFEPAGGGANNCLIQTGMDCDNVSCTGEGVIPVYVDILPAVCPNKMRPESPFLLLVSVLGTDLFDVRGIDANTVQLEREGIAGSVAPIRWGYNDLGTPFMGTLCACHRDAADGFEDLNFRFPISDIAATLDVAGLAGQDVPLLVVGNLTGAEKIEGSDCIFVVSGIAPEQRFGEGIDFLPFGGKADDRQITLSFYMSEDEHITLEIFDVQGRMVARLVDEPRPAGVYSEVWDTASGGSRLQSGVYFARLRTATRSVTQKVLVVR
jgi:hypothetical protein